jgi:hypothetical protein
MTDRVVPPTDMTISCLHTTVKSKEDDILIDSIDDRLDDIIISTNRS